MTKSKRFFNFFSPYLRKIKERRIPQRPTGSMGRPGAYPGMSPPLYSILTIFFLFLKLGMIVMLSYSLLLIHFITTKFFSLHFFQEYGIN